MKKSSNPWTEYYAAKSQSEKEAILKKIYPGITQKGLEIFKRKMPVPEAEERAEINKPVEEKALPHMTQEHFDSLLALQMATTEEEVRGAVDNLPLLTEDEKKELVEKILKGGE